MRMRFRFPAFPAERRFLVFILFWGVSGVLLSQAPYNVFREPYTLAWSAIDRHIPFTGWFIYPYFSHFVLLLLTFVLLKDARNTNRLVFALSLTTITAV